MKTTRIPIGTLSTIRIEIPVITLGREKPRVALLTGLHGGEESGIRILAKIMPELEEMQGTFTILPAGNPLTQAFKQRFSPADGMNPNRAFPGSRESDLSRRIGRATMDILEQQDFVIDLHCFSQDCPFTGVRIPSANPAIEQYIKNALAVLNPDVIWVEKVGTPDGLPNNVSSSGAVIEKGIPSIALEMPRADHMTQSMEARITQSVLAVLRAAASGKLADAALPSSAPEITRRDVRADDAGFFLPSAKPMDRVEKGTVLGSLLNLETFEEMPIESRAAGLLFLITRPGVVNTGDKLYSIGLPV